MQIETNQSRSGEEPANIAVQLRERVRILPDKPAILEPAGREAGGRIRYRSVSFGQLDTDTDALALGLEREGITRGVRTLVMVRPGIDFFAVMFALFKVGAVPVLIDPGMGAGRLLRCVRAASPQALVGVPLAHLARLLRPRACTGIRHLVTVGRRLGWGGTTLAAMRRAHAPAAARAPRPIAPTRACDLAAILFTSGSTGPAKGVEYEHGMFLAQCRMLERVYDIGPDDVDLPAFPPFALFSVALGMTAVIPRMDPTRPAAVDPRAIVEPIVQQRCTFSFGSPALWARVSAWCLERNVTLPSLRRVLMAGAPVPPEVHERLLRVLPPGAQTHTPYGATESLPVSDMRGTEVVGETAARTRAGKGVCVGRPVPGVEVRIIRVTDGPIFAWSDALEAPPGEVGEIVTRGAHVTRAYFADERATRAAKIPAGEGCYHRMGDLGYFDAQGRLWFCGRRAHRVRAAGKTMYPVCVEAIFNRHPLVARSALVGVGAPPQKPVIVIEPARRLSGREWRALRAELLARAREQDVTRGVEEVLLHARFPVDIRHNAKIDREELARLVASRPARPGRGA